jgi:hypothetical protein
VNSRRKRPARELPGARIPNGGGLNKDQVRELIELSLAEPRAEAVPLESAGETFGCEGSASFRAAGRFLAKLVQEWKWRMVPL